MPPLAMKPTPPEPSVAPAELAYAAAAPRTVGSWIACSRRTECTSLRKCGFSRKERGVTGRAVVVPRARWAWGGEVGVRVRV